MHVSCFTFGQFIGIFFTLPFLCVVYIAAVSRDRKVTIGERNVNRTMKSVVAFLRSVECTQLQFDTRAPEHHHFRQRSLTFVTPGITPASPQLGLVTTPLRDRLLKLHNVGRIIMINNNNMFVSPSFNEHEKKLLFFHHAYRFSFVMSLGTLP